jgi:hypothetical protein
MTLPQLTLTWPNDVRVYYDPNSSSWTSDYEEPDVSEAYITLMQIMTHAAFLSRYGYRPYPLLDRIEELATELSFTLDGMSELTAALVAETTEMIKDGVIF